MYASGTVINEAQITRYRDERDKALLTIDAIGRGEFLARTAEGEPFWEDDQATDRRLIACRQAVQDMGDHIRACEKYRAVYSWTPDLKA